MPNLTLLPILLTALIAVFTTAACHQETHTPAPTRMSPSLRLTQTPPLPTPTQTSHPAKTPLPTKPPTPAPPTSTPTPPPTTTQEPRAESSNPEQALKDRALQAARQYIKNNPPPTTDPDGPSLTIWQPTEWGSGAMGCPGKQQAYTDAMVPGYIAIFDHQGKAIRVHLDSNGRRVFVANRRCPNNLHEIHQVPGQPDPAPCTVPAHRPTPGHATTTWDSAESPSTEPPA